MIYRLSIRLVSTVLLWDCLHISMHEEIAQNSHAVVGNDEDAGPDRALTTDWKRSRLLRFLIWHPKKSSDSITIWIDGVAHWFCLIKLSQTLGNADCYLGMAPAVWLVCLLALLFSSGYRRIEDPIPST